MKNLKLLKKFFYANKSSDEFIGSLPQSIRTYTFDNPHSQAYMEMFDISIDELFGENKEVANWVIHEWSPKCCSIKIDGVRYEPDTEEKLWKHLEEVEGWR